MTRQAHERRLKEKKQNKKTGREWAWQYAFLESIKNEPATKAKIDAIWNRKDDPD